MEHAILSLTNMSHLRLKEGSHLNLIAEEIRDDLEKMENYGAHLDFLSQLKWLLSTISLLAGTTSTDFSKPDPLKISSMGPEITPIGRYASLVSSLRALIILGQYNLAFSLADSYAKDASTIFLCHWLYGEYIFYYGLAQICWLNGKGGSRSLGKSLEICCKKVRRWAHYCPENFEYRALLLDAEIARLKGDKAQALNLYERAVNAVESSGIAHEHAFSLERLVEFVHSQGWDQLVSAPLQKAHNLYFSWGANAKLKLIQDKYGVQLSQFRQFKKPKASTFNSTVTTIAMTMTETGGTTKTSGNDSNIFDLNTVIKASLAISGEINLEHLLTQMMKIILENAGAQKGFLILESGGQPFIEASAHADPENVEVFLNIPLSGCQFLSESMVRYVSRSGKDLVLPDATIAGDYQQDPYVLNHRPKSVLCTPIRHQNQFIGVLYLENNLSCNIFTIERMRVLHILLAQAAISLENAKLYEQLIQARDTLEERVQERTCQLESAQKELLDQAHKAGMADIATGVLHNIGNILNSVKTSAAIIIEDLEKSKVKGMARANELLRNNLDQLESFIANDPKGKKLMKFYLQLEGILTNEQLTAKSNLNRLLEKIQAISDVVMTQQTYAKGGFFSECLSLEEVIENVLTLQTSSIERHQLTIIKKFQKAPPVQVQKTKLIQILVNLYKNAKEAMTDLPIEDRTLVIEVFHDDTHVTLKFSDNGCGVKSEDLGKIFTHGFTTKEAGHGFGLHSCANYMTEMGGDMWAESLGKGQGVTFNLKFPLRAQN